MKPTRTELLEIIYRRIAPVSPIYIGEGPREISERNLALFLLEIIERLDAIEAKIPTPLPNKDGESKEV